MLLSRSSIKVLNRIDSNTEPWVTQLITDYQLDLAPFTTTFQAQPAFNPVNGTPVQATAASFSSSQYFFQFSH